MVDIESIHETILIASWSIVILSSKTCFNSFSQKMSGDVSRGTVRLKVKNVLIMISVDKNSFYCINSKVVCYGNNWSWRFISVIEDFATLYLYISDKLPGMLKFLETLF